MKISDLLPVLGYRKYNIEYERDFDFLSLCSEKLDFACCVFIDDIKYIDSIAGNVTMVLTDEKMRARLPKKDYGVCFIDQPRLVFFKLHNYLSGVDGYKRGKSRTTVGERCQISQMASIAAENVVIGNDVVIEEFVVIRENTTIGDRSVIRAGTVIGGQGFEFKHDGEGVLAVEHTGGVIIGHDVELQQHNCVDRAVYPWDDTIIGDYVKTAALAHMAHAVKLGNGVMIAAGGLVMGRTRIKENAWIGPGVTVSNGIVIGENSRVNIGSVATKSVEANVSVTGNFAIVHDKFIRNLKHAARDSEPH